MNIRCTLLVLFAISFTIVYSQSLADGFNPKVFNNATVNKIKINSQGDILISGPFQFVNGTVQRGIAKVKPEGGTVPGFAFNAEWLQNGQVDIADAGNGRTIYGGQFRSVDGEVLPNLIRLNTDGSVDPTFQSDVDFLDDVISVLVLSDGNLLVLGGGRNLYGDYATYIFRTDSLGIVDTTFNMLTFQNSALYKAAEQAPGQYLVSGFIFYSALEYMIRVDSSGHVDPSFNFALNGVSFTSIRDFMIGADGHIAAANFGNGEVNIIDPDGGLVSTFPLPFDPQAIAELPNGRILAGGRDGDLAIIENSNVTTWPGAADDRITAIAVQGSENVIIGGRFEKMFDHYDAGLSRAKLLPGELVTDTTFGTRIQVSGSIVDMAGTPEGDFLMVGRFDEINGNLIRNIAKMDVDGSVSDSFEENVPAVRKELNSVEVLPDGNVLVAGSYVVDDFSFYEQLNGIARLNADGAFLSGGLDFAFPYSVFPCNSTGNTSAALIGHVEITTEDRFFALSGSFCSGPGPNDSGQNFVRLNGDGSLDLDVDQDHLDYLQGIRGVTPLDDGKYYVYGRAISYDGSVRTGVVRANESGDIDNAFDYETGENMLVTTVAEINTDVYVGGYDNFSIEEFKEAFLVRLDDSGNPDPGFLSGTATLDLPNRQPTIDGTYLTDKGRIIVFGRFDRYNGSVASGVAVLDQAGNYIGGLDEPIIGGFDNVFELSPNLLLVSGVFTTESGSHVSLAKIELMETGTIANVDQNRIKVFPNPVANETVNIELAARADFSYELIDAFGRRVGVHGTNDNQVNLGGLPGGMYTLLIHAGGDIFYENIVKN